MKHHWKTAAPFLGLLLLSLPQAYAQTTMPRSVAATGAIRATDGTRQINATLGQPAIGTLSATGGIAALGFWHPLPRTAATTEAHEEPTTGSTAMLDASPNPFAAATTLSLQLPQSGRASVILYNLLAQPVRTLLDAEQQAGTLTIRLDADDLPSGRYLVRLSAPGAEESIPLLLVR